MAKYSNINKEPDEAGGNTISCTEAAGFLGITEEQCSDLCEIGWMPTTPLDPTLSLFRIVDVRFVQQWLNILGDHYQHLIRLARQIRQLQSTQEEKNKSIDPWDSVCSECFAVCRTLATVPLPPSALLSRYARENGKHIQDMRNESANTRNIHVLLMHVGELAVCIEQALPASLRSRYTNEYHPRRDAVDEAISAIAENSRKTIQSTDSGAVKAEENLTLDRIVSVREIGRRLCISPRNAQRLTDLHPRRPSDNSGLSEGIVQKLEKDTHTMRAHFPEEGVCEMSKAAAYIGLTPEEFARLAREKNRKIKVKDVRKVAPQYWERFHEGREPFSTQANDATGDDTRQPNRTAIGWKHGVVASQRREHRSVPPLPPPPPKSVAEQTVGNLRDQFIDFLGRTGLFRSGKLRMWREQYSHLTTPEYLMQSVVMKGEATQAQAEALLQEYHRLHDPIPIPHVKPAPDGDIDLEYAVQTQRLFPDFKVAKEIDQLNPDEGPQFMEFLDRWGRLLSVDLAAYPRDTAPADLLRSLIERKLLQVSDMPEILQLWKNTITTSLPDLSWLEDVNEPLTDEQEANTGQMHENGLMLFDPEEDDRDDKNLPQNDDW